MARGVGMNTFPKPPLARAGRAGGVAVVALPALALALQGCAGGGSALTTGAVVPSVTSYKQGNAIQPQGYSMSQVDDRTVRVTATGSPSTPNERLVKIAMARAAEYGVERNEKSFRAAEPAISTSCGKDYVIERGARRAVQPSDYRIVSVDVTYGGRSTDPADRPTRETASTLKAELAAETVPETVQAANTAELAQFCGRTAS